MALHSGIVREDSLHHVLVVREPCPKVNHPPKVNHRKSTIHRKSTTESQPLMSTPKSQQPPKAISGKSSSTPKNKSNPAPRTVFVVYSERERRETTGYEPFEIFLCGLQRDREARDSRLRALRAHLLCCLQRRGPRRARSSCAASSASGGRI